MDVVSHYNGSRTGGRHGGLTFGHLHAEASFRGRCEVLFRHLGASYARLLDASSASVRIRVSSQGMTRVNAAKAPLVTSPREAIRHASPVPPRRVAEARGQRQMRLA